MPLIIVRYFFYGLKQADTEFGNDTTVVPKFWNGPVGKHFFTLMGLFQLVDYFALWEIR